MFPTIHDSALPGNWRKSSRSGTDGNCVETASTPGAVLVRDTTDRSGPVLAFSAGTWKRFASSLK